MGLILSILKPGARSLRRRPQALSVLSRAAPLLGPSYLRLASSLVLAGPSRRVLSALEALGPGPNLGVAWLPSKSLCKYRSRRPRSLKRSILARGPGLDKV